MIGSIRKMYISNCSWCGEEGKTTNLGITGALDSEEICKECDKAFLKLRKDISGKKHKWWHIK